MPPQDPSDRANHCRIGDTHMWRKSKEACKPELAGEGTYSHQVPACRAVPMWGGISEGGFSVILFHDNKKLTSDDWVESVEDDDVLVNAVP